MELLNGRVAKKADTIIPRAAGLNKFYTARGDVSVWGQPCVLFTFCLQLWRIPVLGQEIFSFQLLTATGFICIKISCSCVGIPRIQKRIQERKNGNGTDRVASQEGRTSQ